MKNKNLLSWALLLALALIWGSSFILIKRGVEGLNPIQMASLRIFMASLFLSPFLYFALKLKHKKDWKFLFLSGLSGNLVPAYLFAFAQTNISSSLSGILNSLSPFFTLLVGYFFFSQKLNVYKVIGVFVGLGGAVMLIIFKNNSYAFSLNYYALLVIVATFGYGLSVNILKFKLSEMKPLYTSTLALSTVGPLAGIGFVWSGGAAAIMNSDLAMQSAFYTTLLGFMSTALALILFNQLVQNTSAIFASSVTYIMPVIAIFWGVLDGETVEWIQYVGMGVVLAAIVIIRKS